ncbi:kinase-like domain-containing protein [Biscogniauxia marginata]|nr:kinase-like domain-containing protein [Biscogniauxia marginata]
MLSPPETFVGQSGRVYSIERVLQQKESPSRHVYLGTYKFVLKNVSESSFVDYQDLYRGLQSCPHLRVPCDTIPERSAFVYRYLSDTLLSLAQEDLPLSLVKRILKDALRGLSALHDRDTVHTDIKADNILVQRSDPHSATVDLVQLADLEDSAHVPPGSHASGPVNKPSDMFSFGIVCLYAVHKRVIFAVGEDELGEGEDVLSHVLERQISYFADEEVLAVFLRYLGDNPWVQVFSVIRDNFNGENPRKPVSQDVDADLRHLVAGLTDFDPAKRLTAHEALDHHWFDGA